MLMNVSCKKTNEQSLIPDGTYMGTFQRQTTTGGKIAKSKINFSGSEWNGEIDSATYLYPYPGLCRGTYKSIGSDSIYFGNECVWTTNFDGTLVLGNAYQIKLTGEHIEIIRNYGNDVKGVYELVKQ